jgi:hypothetical protein
VALAIAITGELGRDKSSEGLATGQSAVGGAITLADVRIMGFQVSTGTPCCSAAKKQS